MTFKAWMEDIAEKHGKNVVIPGMELTGHYWFNLGAYLQDNGMKPVHVNPHHVKKSKELDDNNPNKTDRKDPKTIAALVNEGRFSYPYIPTGIYAEIPYIDKLLKTKGIGLKTVSGFIAEVGDIKHFDNPKQLQKLAGYAIVECSSGKHKGESHISYRGRKHLRYVLYEAAISLIARNEEFKKVYRYYRTRKENPLKKMQSVIAVACKAMRIFFTILTKGVDYDGAKMLQDIKRPQLIAT